MIVILDNGNGADKISSMLRAKSVVGNKLDKNATAYILSDGKADEKSQKACMDIIEKAEVPVLGIGVGAAYIAGFFGADVVETKSSKEIVSVKKPCALLLDMKRKFQITRSGKYIVSNLPEELEETAVSKTGSEVFMATEAPYFGVCFNPEEGGDGITVLRNFEKFITEVWEKYHK